MSAGVAILPEVHLRNYTLNLAESVPIVVGLRAWISWTVCWRPVSVPCHVSPNLGSLQISWEVHLKQRTRDDTIYSLRLYNHIIMYMYAWNHITLPCYKQNHRFQPCSGGGMTQGWIPGRYHEDQPHMPHPQPLLQMLCTGSYWCITEKKLRSYL